MKQMLYFDFLHQHKLCLQDSAQTYTESFYNNHSFHKGQNCE